MFEKYKLELIVFTTGASVMILEMVGSRVLAPYLGTSIIVWTSLIGLILGSLSLGYWYGGRLADKNPSWQTFATLILFSAILITLIALIKEPLLAHIQKNILDIRVGSFFATLILFCPPSVLLGMVSPYAVKLKIKNLETSATTVGSLYAISTVGSIVGTFAAGFVLISYLGNTNILFLLSTILLITSIIADPKNFFKTRVALVVLVIILAFWRGHQLRVDALSQGLVDVDTRYSRIRIEDGIYKPNGRPMRGIVTDPYVIQSARYLDTDDDNDVIFEYTKFYRLAGHFVDNPNSGLVIGGAGYTAPRSFLASHPEAKVDVVEIDPKMTELARKYFSLKDDPRLKIFHEDARTYLARSDKKYDVIFMDAFQSVYSVPYQLTTAEAIESMHERLNSDGIVLANIISSIEGSKGKFIRAEYATYKSVFPHVYIFQTKKNLSATQPQNLILFASKSPEIPKLTSENAEFPPCSAAKS